MISAGRSIAPLVTCSLLCATAVYAQGDPFQAAAGGVSNTAVNVVRLLGIAFLGGGGIGMMMDHNHGVGGKLTAMGLGGVFTFLPVPIASYIQGLHG